MRTLYIYCLALCLSIGGTITASAFDRTPSYEINEDGEIRVSVSNTSVRVQNAADKTLEVYDITGIKVASYRIDSTDRVFTLGLPKGYYILKIGNFTRKISIY